MKIIKILIIAISILSFNNCYYYRINVNTIPGDEAEVFIDGVPKGQTDSTGKLEFEYNNIPDTKSPVIYARKGNCEGWFKYNVWERSYPYKNVCDFKIDYSDKELRTIEITFLLDSSNSNEIKKSCSLDRTSIYSRDYTLKPPRRPVAQSIIGISFLTLGIAGHIVAMACFSYGDKYEGPAYSSLSNNGALNNFFGSLGLLIGIPSLGLGTTFILGSIYKRKNYYEWMEYQNCMDTKLKTHITIAITKNF